MGNALVLLFTIGWIPVFLLRAETWHVALPAYDRGERIWIVLTPVIIAAHFTLGCLAARAELSIPMWRAVVSAAVFVLGIFVWLWGRSGIGPLRVRRLPSDVPSAFRRDGAFAMVRHPMYFGHLLASLAPLLATPSLSLMTTFLACTVAVSMIAIQEERRLHSQLGPVYAEYCRDVKRLIPFIW